MRSETLYTISGQAVRVGLGSRDTCSLDDMAHGLALINRYLGQTPKPYSVAQHCVLMATVVPDGFQLEALIHDAHEVFVGDVPRPLKRMLPDFCKLEAAMERSVRAAFKLPSSMSPEVKEADLRMLVTEARALGMSWWQDVGVDPYPGMIIEPWEWQSAKRWWLQAVEKFR